MHILIVEARYIGSVTDVLVDGATLALEKAGAEFTRLAMPGALELPSAIAVAAGGDDAFDGYVALGCVIGDKAMHDAIYREASHGLAALGLSGVAIGNGLVLAADEGEALVLAQDNDVGGEAVRACLALLTLRDRLGYLK
ncbi:MAG TPA: 6,7-dimethyl-8-ribityllumazine synthase [Rhizomicrobium sp.]|nr:6,7-dimethyl-8-ribityllumazine synthase [Rhizomicrobium sp.]